jgi:type II secretory pathway pseudopilin PulG
MKFSMDRINSFFLEMIFVIFFFSISVTVTTQLFVSAAARADRSKDLSAAVFQAQNAAEQVRGLSLPDEVPQMLRAAARTDADGGVVRYRVTYDAKWIPTEKDPRYAIDVSVKRTHFDSGTLLSAEIEVSSFQAGGTTRLVHLSPAKYFPEVS